MIIDYKNLGKRISETRKEMNLTQEKLAEITELSSNYISNIENNHSIPSLETFILICNALDKTPDYFLLDSNSNSKEYLNESILKKIEQCSSSERRLIDGFISLLLNEHSNRGE